MIIKGLPIFKTDKELFDFLVENEETIIAQSKSQIKEADSFGYSPIYMRDGFANKAAAVTPEELLSKPVLDVKAIINTTNILDSHKDVHIPGLWKNSLKNYKRLLHVQEHKSQEFDKIISSGDDLKAYTKTYTWRELGFDFDGETEALEFNSKVKKDRNEYMHKLYAKKLVDNHSVGMYYDKLATCINHEDYPVQKENWDKYSPMIINKEELKKTKVFWAVLEAKAIEGSAVPNGSNWATPTTSVKESKEIKNKAIIKWLNS